MQAGRVVLGVTIAFTASVVLAAGTAEQQCAAAKRKAAGKTIAKRMLCHATSKARMAPLDPACVHDAEARLEAAFAKEGGVCPGTAADVAPLIDDCVGRLLSDVPGDGVCPARSARAAGMAASRQLRCAAAGLARPFTAPACFAKRRGQLVRTLDSIGDCGQSAALPDDVERVCRDPLAAALPPTTTTTTTVPTTTTTTRTTTTRVTTTTTTTLPVCADTYQPTCGGTCPFASTCAGYSDAFGTPMCGCQFPSCGSYPECGGSCPEGSRCAAISDEAAGTSCGCIAPGTACDACVDGDACLTRLRSQTPVVFGCAARPTCFETYVSCSGGIPAGWACQAVERIASSAVVVSNRCEAVPSAASCSHTCGPAAGRCPDGEVCILGDPAWADCGCAPRPTCYDSDGTGSCPDTRICVCHNFRCACGNGDNH